jgi:hypothetical protein
LFIIIRVNVMKNINVRGKYLAIAALVAAFMLTGPKVLAAGDLIGYWNFDEATGTTAADSSGNSNDGTFTGPGVTHSTVLPPTSCFVNTHSLQFNGSGDYVNIPDNATMDPANQISISFWMNPDTVTNGYQHVVFKQGPVVTSYGVWLNGDHVYMEDNDNTVRGLNSNSTVTPGVWYYITVTYNGTDQDLYIDGVLDNHQTIPGITLAYTNSPVKVGSGDYNNPFAGYVDDLRIYDRALTQAEVTDLASGGCGPGVASAASQNNPTTQNQNANPSTQATVTTSGSDPATLTDTGLNITLSTCLATCLLISAIIVRRFKIKPKTIERY